MSSDSLLQHIERTTLKKIIFAFYVIVHNIFEYLLLSCQFTFFVFLSSCVFIIAGNLGRVDYITENEYDIFIRPDTCNPRFRVWFNFTVENVKADQRVIFNIVNFSKTKSLYRDGMTPIVKSTNRPKW